MSEQKPYDSRPVDYLVQITAALSSVADGLSNAVAGARRLEQHYTAELAERDSPAAPDVAGGVEEEPGVGAVVRDAVDVTWEHRQDGWHDECAPSCTEPGLGWKVVCEAPPLALVTPAPQPDEGGTVEDAVRHVLGSYGVEPTDPSDPEGYGVNGYEDLVASLIHAVRIRAGQVDGVRAVGAGEVTSERLDEVLPPILFSYGLSAAQAAGVMGDLDQTLRAALGDA